MRTADDLTTPPGGSSERKEPDDAATPTRGSDYAQLLRRIKAERLMDRRLGWYAWKIGSVAAMLAVGWTAFVLIGDSWWQLLTAVWLAIAFTQSGFVGHDAGHRQIFRRKKHNDVLGFVFGNLFMGLGYGYWVNKHTKHHSNPNHEDLDPDVDIAVIAFSQRQAAKKRSVFRFIAAHQAVLFFPLLTLQAVQMHLTAFRETIRGNAIRPRLELVLLSVHTVAYFATVFLVLSPVKALVFMAVHQALLGIYLGISFAPNHKGMPIMEGEAEPDFLRRQVLTARNVRGSRFVDFSLGGLNYQIEHHLFPGMPRPHLRRAQVLVKEFCRERGIDYCETGPVESYAEVLRHLHESSASLRRPVKAAA